MGRLRNPCVSPEVCRVCGKKEVREHYYDRFIRHYYWHCSACQTNTIPTISAYQTYAESEVEVRNASL